MRDAGLQAHSEVGRCEATLYLWRQTSFPEHGVGNGGAASVRLRHRFAALNGFDALQNI